MPIEPGIVDANVLVYALDADAQQHGASRALLEAARDASATLYVTPQILCEFYSIITQARRVPTPDRHAPTAQHPRGADDPFESDNLHLPGV